MPGYGKAAESLAEEWTADIAAGRMRSGDPMPKIRTLSSERRLSHSTLVAALRILEEGGLLHRSGKTWIVGPRPPSIQGGTRSGARPGIVLLSYRSEEWSEFHGDHLLSKFVSRFGAEADRFKVRLLPALVQAPAIGLPLFPAGMKEVRSMLEKLGARYLGAIILPMPDEFPGIDGWLGMLNRFRRPILLLQDNDPGRALPASRNLVRISYGDWGRNGRESSAGLTIEALAEAGHRTAGLACNVRPFEPWIRTRLSLLRQAALDQGVPMELRSLLDPVHGAPWGKAKIRALIHSALRHPWVEVRRCAEKFRSLPKPTGEDRDFLAEALLLEPLLRDGQVTALIAPNDAMARRQFTTLRRAGWRIPEDLSMISFDNSPALSPYPISSIDFGLDALGYRAFHILLGSLPMRLGRTRKLLGVNSLADHGSLARPRRPLKPGSPA